MAARQVQHFIAFPITYFEALLKEELWIIIKDLVDLILDYLQI